jgi:hypothetical protein
MHGYPIALTLPDRRRWDISEGTPLCCALETIAADDHLNRETLVGMPWLSPILGSGCLDLGDGPPLEPEALAGIEAAMKDAADGADPTDHIAAVRAFVAGLVAARAPGTAYVEPDGAPSAATRLVAVAALLTESYHEGSRRSFRPVGSRFLNIPVPLDTRLRVIRGLMASLRNSEAHEELARLWGTRNLWKDLAEQVHQSLHRVDTEHALLRAEVSGADVQLLTEFAWLAIVRGSSLYPGWSDLLVGLWRGPSQGSRLRGAENASMNLSSLATDVANILDPITEASWKSWISGDASANTERRTFYAEIARLLTAQATIRDTIQPWNPKPRDQSADDYPQKLREWRAREKESTASRQWLTDEMRAHAKSLGVRTPPGFDWRLPRPVAVVTSFDLELEMAFWSRGEPFVEVLPVLARPSVGNRPGAVVWLAAKFDPRTDAEAVDDVGNGPQPAVLRNGRRKWIPFTDVSECWSNLPTIVRLSGSPMITISPEALTEEFYEATGFARGHRVELIHALTIDEYSSLTFAAHELYSVAAETRPSQGLPSELLQGTATMSRVWVSFGMQVDDAAVRTRLFSQLSVSSIQAALGDLGRDAQVAKDADEGAQSGEAVGARSARRQGGFGSVANGVAFNRRFSEADTTVMRWLGFEFNEVQVKNLINDMNSCGDHLDRIIELLADGLKTETAAPSAPRVVDPVNWGRALPNGCPRGHKGGRA